MHDRNLDKILKRFAKIYPALAILGPRQSGKTTLARSHFKDLPYVSFENPDIQLLAKNDPRAFLEKYKSGAIFDEIQRVPQLFSYLQQLFDETSKKGRFVLTGSQNFLLNAQISQSLSGRIGLTTLLPLSLAELNSKENFTAKIFKGGYPGLHRFKIKPAEFYPSYIQTYIERDVRQLQNIDDFTKFRTFIKLCAGRVGQIINFSSLALDCGISHTTARKWLTLLETSYVIFLLSPFHKNFSKRLIKMPKLYFYDTGLVCNLLGIEKKEQIESHFLKGALFENLVILELLKSRYNQALPANLFFWRDKTGHEIDCLAEWQGKLKAIEIKSGATFNSDFIKDLKYFSALNDNKNSNYLVYNGNEGGTHLGINLTPLQNLKNLS